jgi:predicted branched-subunit amino acid permease
MSVQRTELPAFQFMAGLKAIAPVLLGVIPFGLISGIAVTQVQIEPLDGLVMSVMIFSGAALLVALQLITSNMPALVILLSALAVNLRFLIYSASIAPYVNRLSKGWKVLLAYLLSDQAYAVSIFYLREGTSPGNRHWHLLGSGLGMWLVWQISVALGLFLGASLPANLSLEFAIPLTFLALAIPAIKDKPTAVAALVSGFSILMLTGLPFNLGMLAAILLGIISGSFFERIL